MKKMPKTQLESTTELISDLEERVSRLNEQINQCAPEDPQINYLNLELEKVNDRLEFMARQREEIISSGVTRYLHPFGSIEDIQQTFELTTFSDHYRAEDLFTQYTKWILDRDATPSGKIKMLNNLVQVYEQYTD